MLDTLNKASPPVGETGGGVFAVAFSQKHGTIKISNGKGR
jgi:hypothetical protein